MIHLRFGKSLNHDEIQNIIPISKNNIYIWNVEFCVEHD